MKRTSHLLRFLAIVLLAACAPLALAAAPAADFPARPVRWIVPTATGAGTDYAARLFAQLASDAWKQSVIVDNRSGASGMIGLEGIANAAPDGYTLGFFSVSQFIDATLLQKFVFEAGRDFTPISLLASTPLVLVTNAATNLNTLKALIAAAKAAPKTLNYSSGGSGGVTHLAMEVMLSKAGIEVVHIPYKGSGPAIVDLLAGRVQLAISTPPAIMQHVKAGRLNALALAVDARSPVAPDIPTFAEAGLPGVSLSSWYGLIGPANMPPELVDRIAKTVTTPARTAAMHDKMITDGLDPILGTPAEFVRFLKAEREQWTTVARNIGFKRDK